MLHNNKRCARFRLGKKKVNGTTAKNRRFVVVLMGKEKAVEECFHLMFQVVWNPFFFFSHSPELNIYRHLVRRMKKSNSKLF